MDRDQLRALPVDALIDVILALQARVAELEVVQVRVTQLEAELASARSPAKTPENSSVPPSQARKANRAERRGRKHGPKRGHVGSSRRRQTPDQVLKIRPTVCGGCGEALGPRDQRRVGKSQVIELPPVRAVLIEVWRYAAVCPACQHRTIAEAPAGLEPHRVFGPRLEAQLGYLHERHHLSYQRLVEVGRELYDLHLSQGAVAYERDQQGLKAVTDPRLFETVFQSPQRWLWESPPDDWQLVLRLPGYAPRRRAALPYAVQLALFEPT